MPFEEEEEESVKGEKRAVARPAAAQRQTAGVAEQATDGLVRDDLAGGCGRSARRPIQGPSADTGQICWYENERKGRREGRERNSSIE